MDSKPISSREVKLKKNKEKVKILTYFENEQVAYVDSLNAGSRERNDPAREGTAVILYKCKKS
jgi:hypothetical protein